MDSKKRLVMFALQFPITLLIGMLLSFAYSMSVHEQPGIDWLVTIILGIVLDVVLTLLNRHDEKKHKPLL